MRICIPLALVAALSTCTPAVAVQRCVPHDRLVERLAKNFGESMTAGGVDDRGNLIQVFSSPEGRWTIVVTIPGGPTCVIAAGDGWTRDLGVTGPPVEERPL